jgi:hypothetical protein
MTKQDAPARIEAKSERPAHASRQFFPFEKNRRAVDRVPKDGNFPTNQTTLRPS